MADLQVDLQLFAQTEGGLRDVQRELEGVEEFDAGLASAAGHAQLGDALEQFGSSWDRRRLALAGQVAAVADGAQAIHETFADLDAQQAARAADLLTAS